MKKVAHKRILLVEENASELSEIKSWINEINENHTLYTVRNCKEALDLLNGNTPGKIKILPDILLLNIYSPEMDGIELLDIIKNYFSLRSIKIFFMIPGFTGEEKTIIKMFNVDGIIAKPFRLNFSGNEAHLLKKLENSLTSSNSLRLQSVWIFPPVIEEVFSGLKNVMNKLVNRIEFARRVVFFKPIAVAILIITTTLITTATAFNFKKKDAVHKMRCIGNTVLKAQLTDRILKEEEKVNNSKPYYKAVKKSTPHKNTNAAGRIMVMPDSIIPLPVKQTPRPLKIVVIEEGHEDANASVK